MDVEFIPAASVTSFQRFGEPRHRLVGRDQHAERERHHQ